MGRRQLGQETAEAGRRSGRSGLDPGPTHTQPYQSSREQRGVSKNIYSESNLMRYCISADNGRMWGWALQGRRLMHSAAGAWGRPALQLKEEVKACTVGPEQALQTHCPIQDARSTPCPGTGTHPRPSRLQRASSTCLPAPSSVEISITPQSKGHPGAS